MENGLKHRKNHAEKWRSDHWRIQGSEIYHLCAIGINVDLINSSLDAEKSKIDLAGKRFQFYLSGGYLNENEGRNRRDPRALQH